jgi:tyrosyl-DNA phosphodiesterase-1
VLWKKLRIREKCSSARFTTEDTTAVVFVTLIMQYTISQYFITWSVCSSTTHSLTHFSFFYICIQTPVIFVRFDKLIKARVVGEEKIHITQMKRRRTNDDEKLSINKKLKTEVITLSDSDTDDDETMNLDMITVMLIEKKTNWNHKLAVINPEKTTQLELKKLIIHAYCKSHSIQNESSMVKNLMVVSNGNFLINDTQYVSHLKDGCRLFVIRKEDKHQYNGIQQNNIVESIDVDDEEEEEEDEELKMAIELSLKDTTNTSTSSSSNNPSSVKFDGTKFYTNKVETQKKRYDAHVLSLPEIIDPNNLEAAYFCTYSFDLQFFKTIIPYQTRSIPITLVKHWKKDSGDSEGRSLFELGKTPLCVINPPLISTYSSMHSKLWLLSFPTFLRVVVSSANLSHFDWECYTQCIWIQDFPKLSSLSTATNEFKQHLVNFWNISTLKLPAKWLDNYDFSGAKVHLMVSVPGYHNTGSFEKYGHMRLRNILKKHNPLNSTQLQNSACYYQISSVGSLSTNWLKEVCTSMNTIMPSKRTDKTGVKVIYPSKDTVAKSKLGIRGGGMIHLRRSNYTANTFPSHVLCDFKSCLQSQENYLAHSKMMVHKSDVNTANGGSINWIYLGSHNLSAAALGKLQKNNTQLFISNYEVGVVLIGNDASNNAGSIPFQIPPDPYSSNTTEPFFVEDYE